jgi:hypothetical protein
VRDPLARLSIQVAVDSTHLFAVQMNLFSSEVRSGLRVRGASPPLWRPPSADQLVGFAVDDYERTTAYRSPNVVRHREWLDHFYRSRTEMEQLGIVVSASPTSARRDAALVVGCLNQLWALFPVLSFFPSDLIEVTVELEGASEWSIVATLEQVRISDVSRIGRRPGKPATVRDVEQTHETYTKIHDECRLLWKRIKLERPKATLSSGDALRILNSWHPRFVSVMKVGSRTTMALKHPLFQDVPIEMEWSAFATGRWVPGDLALQLVAAQVGLSDARLSDILRRRKQRRLPNKRARTATRKHRGISVKPQGE